MLYVPDRRQYYIEDTNGRTSPTSEGFGTALTVGAIATGYGAYVVIGSTDTYPAYGFTLTVNGTQYNNKLRKASVSVAYGARGSESVVIDDILVSERGDATHNSFSMYFPLYVPANTDVSVKFAWDLS